MSAPGESDASVLAGADLRRSAPPGLRRAAARGDVTGFVIAYRAWLEPAAARFRRRRTRFPQFWLSQSAPTSPEGPRPLQDVIERCVGTARSPQTDRFGLGRSVAQWLRGRPAGVTPGSAAERLLAAELLLDPPLDLEADDWLRLWRLLGAASVARPEKEGQFRSAAQLVAEVELPFVQSLLRGPLAGSSAMLKAARGAFETEILAATDGDGTPHASLMAEFGDWFGSLVRTAWWARAFETQVARGVAAERFADLVARAAEFTRGDGSFLFGTDGPRGEELLPLAARAARLPKSSAVGRWARRPLRRFSRKQLRQKPRLKVSGQSDWASSAHLRAHAGGGSDVLGLLHHDTNMRIELCCEGVPVLSGLWEAEVRLGGRRVAMRRQWRCVCWFSDGDSDFVELQLQAGQGVRIDRQILLSRKQHFAWLADYVTASDGGSLRYSGRLPLVSDVMSRADYVSREWRLLAADRAVRVLPVGLEHDRVLSAAGQLVVEGDAVELSVSGRDGLACPLLLDWHPDRRSSDADWNRLTVTQARELLPPGRAAGFRVRVGDLQLISYRSLDGDGPLRTVLGQHTGAETFLATMNGRGQVEPLVQVDVTSPARGK